MVWLGGSEQGGARRAGDHLGAVGHAELPQDLLDVALDRVRRDDQPAGDLLVGGAVDDQVEHGGLWFAKLSGVKHRAVVMAKQVVDEAMLTGGGSSYFTRSELQRLYRDVLAGMFHPSDPESAHATMATAWLGAPEE